MDLIILAPIPRSQLKLCRATYTLHAEQRVPESFNDIEGQLT